MSTNRMEKLTNRFSELGEEIAKINMELMFTDSDELTNRVNLLIAEHKTIQTKIMETIAEHDEERRAEWWDAGCPQGDN